MAKLSTGALGQMRRSELLIAGLNLRSIPRRAASVRSLVAKVISEE
jgi:hypothetical protein